MTERTAEYDIGKYADGFGPGKAGLWFVRRKVSEVVGFAECRWQAESIASAYRALEVVSKSLPAQPNRAAEWQPIGTAPRDGRRIKLKRRSGLEVHAEWLFLPLGSQWWTSEPGEDPKLIDIAFDPITHWMPAEQRDER